MRYGIAFHLSFFARGIFRRFYAQSPWNSYEPVREELFGAQRLAEHAHSLALAQTVTAKQRKGRSLTNRLADNGEVLLHAYRRTANSIDQNRAITPAAEWLLDNYHLVEKQIRQIRSDLPPGYYRQLPKLEVGPFIGYPRVFGVAWAFVAHTDSNFDPDMLLHFVRAYQEVQPLTIGELWAVSITLRIVLIENLRRISEQIAYNHTARAKADSFADQLLSDGPSKDVPIAAFVLAHAPEKISDPFAVQLLHRLRDQEARVNPALTWLDEQLAARATTADAAVREVHRRQGASNVTVRNIITSLRRIGDIDWQEIFEQSSLVDVRLAEGSAFAEMDFPTRNLYRSAIEDLARHSKHSELQIADAVLLASKLSGSEDARQHDPGYYLVAGGRIAFEAALGFKRPFARLPAHLIKRSGIGVYGGAITLLAGVLLALGLIASSKTGLSVISLCVFALLGFFPALDVAVAFVNRAVTSNFGAILLPALELRNGVPSHLRTLVAVPVLLTTVEAVETQIERLEIHHLASPEGDLHFALLSDWTDAASESVQGDALLLATAAAGIARLNARYGPAPGGARFLLFHRKRVWNQSEARWIGWERKRGKLHELNRRLRGATDTNFIYSDQMRVTVPDGIRYVVTLDSDTRLPRDTVRRLIGKMAHPLNAPRFCPVSRRVTEGYAVLQPRVTPSLPVGKQGSLFQAVFSSLSGIDPYASAVSDVYQDLFGEGSYAGKGIYDVDMFEASLAGRVPDSSMLSHDLFEGIFARAGLASDVEVVEEFPARYDVGTLRHHRWARGDWQLLPWIFGRRGAVPSIGRWKMLDNLRRTLNAPACVLALVAGWTLPSQTAMVWTAFILATIFLPALLPVIDAIPSRRSDATVGSHTRAVARDLRLALALSGLGVIFLAHQAWTMADAITRTTYRLQVSKLHLLEWVTAAQTSYDPALSLAGFYRHMAGALVVAVVALALAITFGNSGWSWALPFAAIWIASPAIARWISLPTHLARKFSVSGKDAIALRLTARRTWRFFETFVTAADNMLPPDNFQELPDALAHRTSPTNIGLYLLSVVSARDFGWVGKSDATRRLEATLATVARMEKYRGHLYNWYDTSDLRPLDPKYVSAVDSGNLAGHLIALANACREWREAPIDIAQCRAGVGDALALIKLEAAGLAPSAAFGAALSEFSTALSEPGDTSVDFPAWVDRLIALAAVLADFAPDDEELRFWVAAVETALTSHRQDIDAGGQMEPRLHAIEATARSMALAMEFGFLYNNERQLLAIGYLVAEGNTDTYVYDLLASEARLASFFAIAKGDIPARHWFRLGRTGTPVAQGAALISWSGSMFEYLMPSLVMRAPAGSLLEQTNRLIVRRQIDYGAAQRVPWGISESAYNARDRELTYQYSNFGVPGLGLKRGLGENLVIAPYATALAAMVDPAASAANLARLAECGAQGRYGFYEALDFTQTRVPEGEERAIVRAFMAHHQGMTIVAISDTLQDGLMRARFHSEPMIQSAELLLQERMPRDVSIVRPWTIEVNSAARTRDVAAPSGRRFNNAHQPSPATHLLSNGRFATMLTAAGSGYSRWNGFAVTRWREDSTCDDSGAAILLCDKVTGEIFSAGLQPAGVEPDDYNVIFDEDRAEFTRRDKTLTTKLEIVISAEDDAEVRRLTITNNGKHARVLDVTSYAELALAPQAADLAHPAFSKLFVQTEYLAESGAILATRRRRAPNEPEIWAAHLTVIDDEAGGNRHAWGSPEIETDRARFLGRGNGIRTAHAMLPGRILSNTTGSVLDPVFALRRNVRIEAGATTRIAFWTIIAAKRSDLLDLIDKHRDVSAFARAGTLAWTQAQVQLHHLGMDAGAATLFQRLAGYLVFLSPALRPASATIRLGAGAQSGLWSQGISGDLPIILLRIVESEHLEIAHQLVQAHEYWRMKQFAADLVILNERQSSYVQDLQIALENLVRASEARPSAPAAGTAGRIFILRTDLADAGMPSRLAAAARVVLVAQRGSLFDQLNRLEKIPGRVVPVQKALPVAVFPQPSRPAPPAPSKLEFFNGHGGFALDGKEYVTILSPGQVTPAPWINVIANEKFGFHVATEGNGYTWSVNSRENQITPWSNDPVTDRSGEAFFIQDEESGALWSATASPIRDPSVTYTARHGRGYSRFTHEAHGIATDLRQYVPLASSVKISRVVLRNLSNRARQLSLTAYVEWVLGPSRTATQAFVATAIDEVTGAMFARNPWHDSFGARTAFIDLRGLQSEWTGDRREFIGRNEILAKPVALTGAGSFSNTTGAGLDPCGALRTKVELPPGGRVEIVCLLGDAPDPVEARSLIAQFRAADLDEVEAGIGKFWDDVLGVITVTTPDRSMDIMLNGWLLYQSLVCRIWARSAFYQSSGAYGFRDQLQDGMAFAAARPELTRAHLLSAAARQFVEGDVQHWWLPHSGQGVRTRISDDRAWLAYCTAHYVAVTGDNAVLDEEIPFLEGQALEPGAHDIFFQPSISDDTASLFAHCALALDQSLALGGHGLPLIGTGDWNDGMNRVGEHGAGESVWLAWFLHASLTAFIPLALARGEFLRVETWRQHAISLAASIEHEAWDGDWYRRGFFDDGTPLGSASSVECRIDSIAQSWAVLSGVAPAERAKRAMGALGVELLRQEDKLALLFAPPFDTTPLDPGYIKGYPPGIRENGGQYTHAAIWSVMAFAALGQGDQAQSLFAMLNPINHALTAKEVQRYKVEPYAVAADIYGCAPHTGRGGWTWYTGSAGWMQRAGIERILGVQIRAGFLHIDPCIPAHWPAVEILLRHGGARYAITVENPACVCRGVACVYLDDILVDPMALRLQDDSQSHVIKVILG